MIKLTDLITEALDTDKLWHIYDPYSRSQDSTYAIIKAPDAQSAMKLSKAPRQQYSAEEISPDEARSIKAQLTLKLKHIQRALKSIKI